MSNPPPQLITELQRSDFNDNQSLKAGTIVLLKMKEGYNFFFLNDIKRIGFVSKVMNNDEYEVTYITDVGSSEILKTINAKRDQILNLYLKYNVNIHDTKEKIISVLNRVPDKQPFLTSSESHDMYETHVKALERHPNTFRMVDGGSTHHRRSRRRKSRHHKKTNRRQKSNRHKMHPRKKIVI